MEYHATASFRTKTGEDLGEGSSNPLVRQGVEEEQRRAEDGVQSKDQAVHAHFLKTSPAHFLDVSMVKFTIKERPDNGWPLSQWHGCQLLRLIHGQSFSFDPSLIDLLRNRSNGQPTSE